MPPGGNAGLTAALEIRAHYGDRVRVLVLSQYLEPDYALRLLGSGAGGVGYLLSDEAAFCVGTELLMDGGYALP